MSRRITRIDKRELSSKLSSVVGKDVHVVVRNDHTWFGKLSLNNGVIGVTDAREHTQIIRLEDIVEIIYDEVTPW